MRVQVHPLTRLHPRLHQLQDLRQPVRQPLRHCHCCDGAALPGSGAGHQQAHHAQAATAPQ